MSREGRKPNRSMRRSHPIFNAQQNMNTEILQKAANQARGLAMDAVHKANSGHLGLPLGAADLIPAFFGNGEPNTKPDPFPILADGKSLRSPNRWLGDGADTLLIGHYFSYIRELSILRHLLQIPDSLHEDFDDLEMYDQGKRLQCSKIATQRTSRAMRRHSKEITAARADDIRAHRLTFATGQRTTMWSRILHQRFGANEMTEDEIKHVLQIDNEFITSAIRDLVKQSVLVPVDSRRAKKWRLSGKHVVFGEADLIERSIVLRLARECYYAWDDDALGVEPIALTATQHALVRDILWSPDADRRFGLGAIKGDETAQGPVNYGHLVFIGAVHDTNTERQIGKGLNGLLAPSDFHASIGFAHVKRSSLKTFRAEEHIRQFEALIAHVRAKCPSDTTTSRQFVIGVHHGFVNFETR